MTHSKDPEPSSTGRTTTEAPASEEVWETLLPPMPKARPFPTRPTHWPRRRTRLTRPNNHDKENSDG